MLEFSQLSVNSRKSSSQDSMPIVIDSGFTFGVIPFEEVLIPGTIKSYKNSVKNLSSTSETIKKEFGR